MEVRIEKHKASQLTSLACQLSSAMNTARKVGVYDSERVEELMFNISFDLKSLKTRTEAGDKLDASVRRLKGE